MSFLLYESSFCWGETQMPISVCQVCSPFLSCCYGCHQNIRLLCWHLPLLIKPPTPHSPAQQYLCLQAGFVTRTFHNLHLLIMLIFQLVNSDHEIWSTVRPETYSMQVHKCSCKCLASIIASAESRCTYLKDRLTSRIFFFYNLLTPMWSKMFMSFCLQSQRN